ncbi:glutamine--fructose-6-phosphate transaminase (isomerizing) [Paenibacillus hodogayensis]|uniref:Glutamine--fructose-6-phosphate aminotransferase [isomerizing] n=1 Tax=Paenibacillus hodogayensis TaxID=279208 RepID=A0ABV5W0G2_9BACL
MCGIVGYIGNRDSQSILVEGLKKLEYRGYDSAGVAIVTGTGLAVKKAKGRLAELESRLHSEPLAGTVGIGHTRWATHGKPSDANSHPHTDTTSKFSVVHNGIIENYAELRRELAAKGHVFVSETDTEVVSHLIADLYQGDIVKAVSEATRHIRGAFALAILTEHEPDKLVAVRQSSPLIIGVGDGENFIGSDIPAILQHTRNVYILDDHEMAVLTRSGVELMTIEGNFIAKQLSTVDWDLAAAEKNGFDHFMLKEMHEQPQAYRDTLSGRMGEHGIVSLDELGMTDEAIAAIRAIHIVGCGTAYHAGLAGKGALEKLAGLPVETDLASEYRYREPLVMPGTLLIAVSQSGETADTLAAVREAKRRGALILAITNVVGSSLTREADHTLFTWAGPEIAVASTKAYTTQLLAFYMLAIHLAEKRGVGERGRLAELSRELQQLPDKVERVVAGSAAVQTMARRIAQAQSLFFIGRGPDYAVAMEGSLKLKEISYIQSEAYAAGELKHGTLALIEQDVPVVALATQPALLEKTASNVKEVKARGAYVYGLVMEGHEALEDTFDEVLTLPATDPLLAPAISVVPLQLLAYYTAVERGNDVDKPRNLAKSVTVE